MKSSYRFQRLLSLASLLFAPALSAQTAQYWNGLPLNPSVLTVQREGIAKRAPNSSGQVTSSSLSNLAAGTGVRVRAVITPTVSGNYTFAIAGTKNAALWLSSNESRFNKQLIAWHYEFTSPLQWTKYASQQSASLPLIANTPYYIEAQVMSSTAGGLLDLGWKTPGSSAILSIPIANLSSLAADPADLNDNNLPDAWESQTGLVSSALPGALAEYGDPDNDGITNFDEYLLSSNPLSKEARSNGITRDTWSEIQGQSTGHLTAARSRFLSYANASVHVAKVDETSPNKIEGKNYGARYHGFLVAPATGTYRLWIAGDDDAELWFADGTVRYPGTATPLTNRFGKQLLAHTHNPGGSYYTNYRDFDLLPSQRSRSLQLVEGQTYFIEVLHKNESISGNHISLAWETPGQARVIVPASAFQSDVPEDLDKDADSLPDAWETAKTLSITDNGITSAKEGQYGDFDSDGLNNLLEFQLGTNPKAADTDGDTLSDGLEINYYRTNPLVSNAIATTQTTTLNLASPTETSVPWQTRSNGSILAYERRGWTDWSFTVLPGQEGIHEIRLVGGAEGGAVRTNETLPISIGLDGQTIGRQNMACVLGQNTTLKQLTPFLWAGNHVLRIQNHNVRADCYLRLNSITAYRLGGADANSNGLADWAESKFANENKLTRIPAESFTSPAFIEGITSSLPGLKLTRSVPGSDTTDVAALPGVNDGFYTNLLLDPAQPTQLGISFQGGPNPEAHSIAWAAVNILEHSTITIRQGDSLRLTAHDSSAASPEGSFTLGGGETLLSPVPSGPQPSASPVILLFNTPGTHTLTSTWTPIEGATQTANITVTVASASFGPAFDLQTYNRRTWTLPGVQGMNIEADSALFWNETTAAGATVRSFLVNAYEAGTRRAVARVPATGEIVATGEVQTFSLTRANATGDSQVVERRADGSSVIRFTIVAENLPANAEIRIHMNYQGTVFTNGSRDLILHPSDFNSNGIASVLVEASSDPPQICHSMSASLLD